MATHDTPINITAQITQAPFALGDDYVAPKGTLIMPSLIAACQQVRVCDGAPHAMLCCPVNTCTQSTHTVKTQRLYTPSTRHAPTPPLAGFYRA